MGYSAKAVANYFLSKHRESGITPLKIQKLVYLSHGWHLALSQGNKPLIEDEFAEAWRHGPVFPSLYHEFKHLGSQPLINLAENIHLDNDEVKFTTPNIDESDHQTRELLDQIWEIYGGETGFQLSERCHSKDSPWDKARRNSGGRRNADISDKLIIDHYVGWMNQKEQSNG